MVGWNGVFYDFPVLYVKPIPILGIAVDVVYTSVGTVCRESIRGCVIEGGKMFCQFQLGSACWCRVHVACHKDGLIDVLQGFFYQWYGKELVFWSEGLVCGTKYIIFKFCNNEGTLFFPSGHWNDFVFYGYLSGEDSDAVASTLKRNGCCISPVHSGQFF